MKFEDFLKNYRIFLFAGNGGTGKTTLSAAWAYRAAEYGYKVGLMTIDPSRRLGETFGMNVLSDEYRRLAVKDAYLDVFLIQSEKVIKNFIVQHFSQKTYEELTKNNLFKQVVTHLAENQSVSTIYKLSSLIQSKDYDLIVVDTPPAAHMADFFRSPESTLRLFKENALARALFEQTSFSMNLSKKMFLRTMKVLVGQEFTLQIEAFFSAFFLLQEQIVKSAEFLSQQLKDPQMCYFLVSLPEPQKIQELQRLLSNLKQQGIEKSHLIINRAFPDWLGKSHLQFDERFPDAQKYYDKIWNYYDNRKQSLLTTMEGTPMYFIPEKKSDADIQSLGSILQGAF